VGLIRKGDKVEGISQLQIAAQERSGKVVVDPPVVTAHAGRSVQKQHQIGGRALLSKDSSPRENKKHQNRRFQLLYPHTSRISPRRKS
jgi:hypothetical protein